MRVTREDHVCRERLGYFLCGQVVDSYGCGDLVRRTVHKLLQIRFPSGNLPSSLGSEKDVLVHWCHGAPGLVPLLVKASFHFVTFCLEVI